MDVLCRWHDRPHWGIHWGIPHARARAGSICAAVLGQPGIQGKDGERQCCRSLFHYPQRPAGTGRGERRIGWLGWIRRLGWTACIRRLGWTACIRRIGWIGIRQRAKQQREYLQELDGGCLRWKRVPHDPVCGRRSLHAGSDPHEFALRPRGDGCQAPSDRGREDEQDDSAR